MQRIKSFVEVRKGGLEILLLGINNTADHINLRLKEIRTMDCVGVGFSGSQRNLSLGAVMSGNINLGFDDENFNKQELIIKLFDLFVQILDHLECVLVLSMVKV